MDASPGTALPGSAAGGEGGGGGGNGGSQHAAASAATSASVEEVAGLAAELKAQLLRGQAQQQQQAGAASGSTARGGPEEFGSPFVQSQYAAPPSQAGTPALAAPSLQQQNIGAVHTPPAPPPIVTSLPPESAAGGNARSPALDAAAAAAAAVGYSTPKAVRERRTVLPKDSFLEHPWMQSLMAKQTGTENATAAPQLQLPSAAGVAGGGGSMASRRHSSHVQLFSAVNQLPAQQLHHALPPAAPLAAAGGAGRGTTPPAGAAGVTGLDDLTAASPFVQRDDLLERLLQQQTQAQQQQQGQAAAASSLGLRRRSSSLLPGFSSLLPLLNSSRVRNTLSLLHSLKQLGSLPPSSAASPAPSIGAGPALAAAAAAGPRAQVHTRLSVGAAAGASISRHGTPGAPAAAQAARQPETAAEAAAGLDSQLSEDWLPGMQSALSSTAVHELLQILLQSSGESQLPATSSAEAAGRQSTGRQSTGPQGIPLSAGPGNQQHGGTPEPAAAGGAAGDIPRLTDDPAAGSLQDPNQHQQQQQQQAYGIGLPAAANCGFQAEPWQQPGAAYCSSSTAAEGGASTDWKQRQLQQRRLGMTVSQEVQAARAGKLPHYNQPPWTLQQQQMHTQMQIQQMGGGQYFAGNQFTRCQDDVTQFVLNSAVEAVVSSWSFAEPMQITARQAVLKRVARSCGDTLAALTPLAPPAAAAAAAAPRGGMLQGLGPTAYTAAAGGVAGVYAGGVAPGGLPPAGAGVLSAAAGSGSLQDGSVGTSSHSGSAGAGLSRGPWYQSPSVDLLGHSQLPPLPPAQQQQQQQQQHPRVPPAHEQLQVAPSASAAAAAAAGQSGVLSPQHMQLPAKAPATPAAQQTASAGAHQAASAPAAGPGPVASAQLASGSPVGMQLSDASSHGVGDGPTQQTGCSSAAQPGDARHAAAATAAAGGGLRSHDGLPAAAPAATAAPAAGGINGPAAQPAAAGEDNGGGLKAGIDGQLPDATEWTAAAAVADAAAGQQGEVAAVGQTEIMPEGQPAEGTTATDTTAIPTAATAAGNAELEAAATVHAAPVAAGDAAAAAAVAGPPQQSNPVQGAAAGSTPAPTAAHTDAAGHIATAGGTDAVATGVQKHHDAAAAAAVTAGDRGLILPAAGMNNSEQGATPQMQGSGSSRPLPDAAAMTPAADHVQGRSTVGSASREAAAAPNSAGSAECNLGPPAASTQPPAAVTPASTPPAGTAAAGIAAATAAAAAAAAGGGLESPNKLPFPAGPAWLGQFASGPGQNPDSQPPGPGYTGRVTPGLGHTGHTFRADAASTSGLFGAGSTSVSEPGAGVWGSSPVISGGRTGSDSSEHRQQRGGLRPGLSGGLGHRDSFGRGYNSAGFTSSPGMASQQQQEWLQAQELQQQQLVQEQEQQELSFVGRHAVRDVGLKSRNVLLDLAVGFPLPAGPVMNRVMAQRQQQQQAQLHRRLQQQQQQQRQQAAASWPQLQNQQQQQPGSYGHSSRAVSSGVAAQIASRSGGFQHHHQQQQPQQHVGVVSPAINLQRSVSTFSDGITRSGQQGLTPPVPNTLPPEALQHRRVQMLPPELPATGQTQQQMPQEAPTPFRQPVEALLQQQQQLQQQPFGYAGSPSLQGQPQQQQQALYASSAMQLQGDSLLSPTERPAAAGWSSRGSSPSLLTPNRPVQQQLQLQQPQVTPPAGLTALLLQPTLPLGAPSASSGGASPALQPPQLPGAAPHPQQRLGAPPVQLQDVVGAALATQLPPAPALVIASPPPPRLLPPRPPSIQQQHPPPRTPAKVRRPKGRPKGSVSRAKKTSQASQLQPHQIPPGYELLHSMQVQMPSLGQGADPVMEREAQLRQMVEEHNRHVAEQQQQTQQQHVQQQWLQQGGQAGQQQQQGWLPGVQQEESSWNLFQQL